jgi:hypothetical protein
LIEIANTLDAEAEQVRSLEAVRKTDLRCGDCVLVTTQNSRYTIWVLGEGRYWIWGGWFDRRGISPQRVGINGCTWGGSSIKVDIVAACGLHLEFANTVLTTRIRHIRVIRTEAPLSRN